MIKVEEARSLISVGMYYNSGMNCYVFKVAGKTISVYNVSPEAMAHVFMTSKMKDEQTEPRSSRGKTYAEMVEAVMSGADRENWLWSTHVQTFIDELTLLGGK